MKAAQIDVVERTTQLLAGFNLSTAAPELGPRLENAGHRDALQTRFWKYWRWRPKRASSARSQTQLQLRWTRSLKSITNLSKRS